MHIFIVCDSHCHGLSDVFHAFVPDVSVLTVSVGRQTSLVRSEYVRRIDELKLFSPDRVILHAGHNDLEFHWKYNQEPTRLEDFYQRLSAFADLLKENHPDSILYVSSLFPRTVGTGFTDVDRVIYNRLCVRFGELTRSFVKKQGHEYFMNSPLWTAIGKVWCVNIRWITSQQRREDTCGSRVD